MWTVGGYGILSQKCLSYVPLPPPASLSKYILTFLSYLHCTRQIHKTNRDGYSIIFTVIPHRRTEFKWQNCQKKISVSYVTTTVVGKLYGLSAYILTDDKVINLHLPRYHTGQRTAWSVGLGDPRGYLFQYLNKLYSMTQSRGVKL